MNDSELDLVGLSAIIVSTTPSNVKGVPIERRLHPMAENPDSDGYFTVPRGSRRFVEVAYDFASDNALGDRRVRITYNSDSLTRDLKDDVQILVRVVGANAPPRDIQFKVFAKPTRDRLSIVEIRNR